MQWSDRGIILSVRRLGESSAIIHLMTAEHGMHAGVDRGAFSRAKRGIYQQGNIVAATWQARLSEQLGMLSCELAEPIAAHLLDDRHKLAALTSAMLLMEKILAERETQPFIYARAEALVKALRDDGDWLTEYVRLELNLLSCAGFGLDLASCAATGETENLHYVSPRSGRAVSKAAGMPYHDRLLALPGFLISDAATPVNIGEILDGVRLCGYFLQERVFAPRGFSVPAVRARFVNLLQAKETIRGEAVYS